MLAAAPCASCAPLRLSAPRRHRRFAPPRAGGPPVIDADERSVSLAAGHAAYNAGFKVVDVRSTREFRSETIARAVSAPLYLVPTDVPLGAVDWALSRGSDKLPPFNTAFETLLKKALGGAEPQTAQALLVCSNGQRSREACRLLAEEGYENLRWLEGGLAAWLDAYTPRGLPRKRVVQGVFRCARVIAAPLRFALTCALSFRQGYW